MKYNPDIHHRKSIRLKGYDYSQAGLYFITICTHERECLFGKIVRVQDSEPPQMRMNEGGNVANQCWLEIPGHYPNVVLHEHIVMPNHVHGIIELQQNVRDSNVGAQYFVPVPTSEQPSVGVQNFEPLQRSQQTARVENIKPQRNQFQKIIPGSIGAIIRGYKIGVTKWFRNNAEIYMVWQRNYYEHIIRDEQSHHTIAEYILNNPAHWKEDKLWRG